MNNVNCFGFSFVLGDLQRNKFEFKIFVIKQRETQNKIP